MTKTKILFFRLFLHYIGDNQSIGDGHVLYNCQAYDSNHEIGQENQVKFPAVPFKRVRKKDELIAAVLANNPDLDKEQLSLINSDLRKLSEFLVCQID